VPNVSDDTGAQLTQADVRPGGQQGAAELLSQLPGLLGKIGPFIPALLTGTASALTTPIKSRPAIAGRAILGTLAGYQASQPRQKTARELYYEERLQYDREHQEQLKQQTADQDNFAQNVLTTDEDRVAFKADPKSFLKDYRTRKLAEANAGPNREYLKHIGKLPAEVVDAMDPRQVALHAGTLMDYDLKNQMKSPSYGFKDIDGDVWSVDRNSGRKISNLGKSSASSSSGASDDDVKLAVDAIEAGRQPPEFERFYSNTIKVKAGLEKRGVDVTGLQKDWTAIKKHIQTMQGPTIERLSESLDFTTHSLDQVEELYRRWKDLGGDTGYPLFNMAKLAASKQVPGEMGNVARALEAQIGDLSSDLASVYKGGTQGTDYSLKVAEKNLKESDNEGQFKAAMTAIRRNLGLRKSAMAESKPRGVREDSPLNRPDDAPTPVATAAPSPTPGVPAGWKVEVE